MTSCNRRFQGVWIPSELWLNRELSITEKVMFVEISSLQSDDRGCYASNAHFAEFFNLSISRVSEIISGLSRKGLITIEQIREGKQIIERRIWVSEESDCADTPSEKAMNPFGKGDEPPSEKAKGSNTSFNNTESIKNLSPKSGLAGEIHEEKIIDAWNSAAKKRNFKGTRGLPTKVIRYLKMNYSTYLKQCKRDGKPIEDTQTLTEFTCNYLADGFTEWAGPHYSGENDRKWRADLEFATRTSTFEKVFFNAE